MKTEQPPPWTHHNQFFDINNKEMKGVLLDQKFVPSDCISKYLIYKFQFFVSIHLAPHQGKKQQTICGEWESIEISFNHMKIFDCNMRQISSWQYFGEMEVHTCVFTRPGPVND